MSERNHQDEGAMDLLAKKISLPLLVLGSIFYLNTLIADVAPIKVVIKADHAYPPYSFKEKGKITGIYTDILREAFSKMKKYEVSIEALPWKKGLKELENGESFAIYPPYYHVEARPYIYPYSQPILDESLVLMCSEDGKTKIKMKEQMKWPADFSGLRIGINRGFKVPGLDQARNEKKIIVSEVSTNAINLKKLLVGRIDCMINDYFSIAYALRNELAAGKIDEKFKISRVHVISKEQGFVGFAANAKNFPFKDDFIRQLNIEIYELHRNGRINEILSQYVGH